MLEDLSELLDIKIKGQIKIKRRTLTMKKITLSTPSQRSGYDLYSTLGYDLSTIPLICLNFLLSCFCIFLTLLSSNPDLLYAYNQTKKEFIWKTALSGANDRYFDAPLVDEQHVYIINDFKALAYDKFTGELVWEQELEGWYSASKPLLIEI